MPDTTDKKARECPGCGTPAPLDHEDADCVCPWWCEDCLQRVGADDPFGDVEGDLDDDSPRAARYDDVLDLDDEPCPGTRPDRLSAAVNRPFDDKSLIGSFFLSGHERGWQGCVVAEVAPQVFLVETAEWLMGDGYDQQLVTLADMAGWTFYDTAEWMRNAYDHGVRQRWERERKAARGAAA